MYFEIADTLSWMEETRLDEQAIAAHAKPCGKSNLHYLHSLNDHVKAVSALAQRSLDAGVFGHTHRPRLFNGVRPFGPFPFDEQLEASCRYLIVINAETSASIVDGTG